MATLGSLIISLEANTAKFESAMTKAEYAAKKASDNIIGAFKILGTGLAAAFSLSAMDAAFDRITKMESDLLKMANRLNTNVETLSSFSVMMRKTGMDADTFYTTLTRMDKGLSAAAAAGEKTTGIFDENGEEILKTAKTYDELGINAKELIKLPLAERMMAIAEAMQKNVAPQDQLRLAMEMGGRGAAGMVNVFREGPEAMQKWIDRAQELGIITTDMAKRATEAKAAAGDLSLAWDAFARSLVDSVAPAITKVLNLMTQLIISKNNIMQFAPETVFEHGVVPEEKFVGPPTPPKPIPEQVFKTPIKPSEIPKGGGKGGGGDMGLSAMQSIIDTLQKDLSRLTEGSLSEIRDWATKMQHEIEKVGAKGAETETAMALVAQVETGKKKKATEDYELFVASQSGNMYLQIEADAKGWLTKYKGFADSEVNIASIKNRKIAEEDNRQQSEKLGIQKGLMDSIANQVPLLSQQLAIKQAMLPLEQELNRLQLERQMSSLKLTEDDREKFRALQRVVNRTNAESLEREKLRTGGIAGGLKLGGEELEKSAETWAADATAELIRGLPKQLSGLMASGFIGFLQGKAPDIQQLGISMAEAFIQSMLEGVLNQVIPVIAKGLGDALSGILGGGGGGDILSGIIGGVFSLFHQGGMIQAHRGWPLRYDERLILAQTGERVLSRDQNRAYEAGLSGGGSRGDHIEIHNHFPNQSTVELDRYARRMRAALDRHQARKVG